MVGHFLLGKLDEFYMKPKHERLIDYRANLKPNSSAQNDSNAGKPLKHDVPFPM